MKAVYINCKERDFIKLILEHKKTVETRNKNTLLPLVGERIALFESGGNVRGYAKICSVEVVDREADWRLREKYAKVKGTSYSEFRGKKFLYYLDDVEECTPYRPMILQSGGRSYCYIDDLFCTQGVSLRVVPPHQ